MNQPLWVEFDPENKAVILTLNRPDCRNALNLPLLHSLKEEILKAQTSTQKPRAIIFKGNGKVFCAGLDLAQTANQPHEAAEAVKDLLLTIAKCSLITISLVHGAAVAGGCGIATTCDFCIMAEDAKIGLPEVRRGLVPALVSVFLRRQLRERDMRELMFAGEPISAKRAFEIGLVNRVVEANQLLTEANQILSSVLQGAPQAIALTKELLHNLAPTSLEQDCVKALDIHNQARDSAEAKEGSKAFLEKRIPNWCGTIENTHKVESSSV